MYKGNLMKSSAYALLWKFFVGISDIPTRVQFSPAYVLHTPTHPVVQLHNDMVGCLVRSKLHVHHSVHSQLGQGRETTSAQVFTQLCVCVGG